MTAPRDKHARAVELYLDSNMNTEEIAAELGIARATLYNWLAAAGVRGRRSAAAPDPELESVLAGLNRRLDDVATQEKLDDICSKLENIETRWEQHDREAAEVRGEIQSLQTVAREVASGLARVQGALEALLAMRLPPTK